MAKKEKDKKTVEDTPKEAAAAPEAAQAAAQEPVPEQPKTDPSQELQKKLDAEHDQRLRLAAEYDNFRKRTQKEKDGAYANGKADTVSKFLPVYDNLARALAQETADTAYKKGVEMTMAELEKILKSLGVESFGEVGEPFDPNLHNAVMHLEDESLGENVLAQVFQRGFKLGDRVIRFAMVQVAN